MKFYTAFLFVILGKVNGAFIWAVINFSFSYPYSAHWTLWNEQ